MRCPVCDASTAAGAEVCPDGHRLTDEQGIFVLLSPVPRAEITELEEALGHWRATQGRAPLPAAALPGLPDGPAVAGDLEWRLRRHDLALITDLISGRQGASILDIGAWNGWLSNRLTAMGHVVTATDLFAGPAALGAPWPQRPGWRRIQIDPLDLERIDETFDVVIADRCLQFYPDPVAALALFRQLVADGGLLIATGLMIHRRGETAASRIAAEAALFRRRFGRDLFLRPTKGFLDTADLARLETAGLATHPYRGLRLAALRARFDGSRPEHRYGLAQR